MSVSFAADQAEGASAGNTIIRNTITVDFSDLKGFAQPRSTSSVDLTVNTIPATPKVWSFSPSPGSTDGTGATQAYTVRIVTNSNGPGSISFATSDGTFTNIGSKGADPTVPAAVYLGATVFDPSNFPALGAQQTIAGNGTLSIAVPNDGGKANDAGATHTLPDTTVINGLAVSDTVYLSDGTSYLGPWQVVAVNDPAVGTGTTPAPGSLTLKNVSGGTLTFTPGYGWEILEAKDVTVTVTQGVVTNPPQPASWITTVAATMTGAADGTGTVTTAAHLGQLTVKKYVRNIPTPTAGTDPSGAIVINGGTFSYFGAGVTGKPGDLLEYLLTITNSGTGKSTAIFAADSIPYYTTLITGSAYGSSGGGTIFARGKLDATEIDLKTDGTQGDATVAYGGSSGTTGGSNLSFYVGNGSSSASPGSLTSGQSVYIVYRVRVN